MTTSTTSYTFSKHERLCSATAIETLFTTGSSKNVRPLKLIYQPNTDASNKIVIVVPKRNFKRANKRNVLKRRLREAYRLHKHLLNDVQPKYNLALLFTAHQETDYATIEKSTIELLLHLNTIIPSIVN
ncbi:MAG: ribonuclease P protein component [Bacteroidia bacterium]|nr:ribonuclease P protein component [Bacteroidia bacterium]